MNTRLGRESQNSQLQLKLLVNKLDDFDDLGDATHGATAFMRSPHTHLNLWKEKVLRPKKKWRAHVATLLVAGVRVYVAGITDFPCQKGHISGGKSKITESLGGGINVHLDRHRREVGESQKKRIRWANLEFGEWQCGRRRKGEYAREITPSRISAAQFRGSCREPNRRGRRLLVFRNYTRKYNALQNERKAWNIEGDETVTGRKLTGNIEIRSSWV
ncbi:hypothetical protein C8R45DRAFT_929322 [Mycena sanguinolenta]|nr:hypothetical protein C8R45DRAFT_929322 [Mycena sanguinolenta]